MICGAGAIYYDFTNHKPYGSIGLGPATPSGVLGVSLATAWGVSPGLYHESTAIAAYGGGATLSASRPLGSAEITGGTVGLTGGIGADYSEQLVYVDDFQFTYFREQIAPSLFAAMNTRIPMLTN